MSWMVAKQALPITRFSIMRPATLTVIFAPSSSSLSVSSWRACKSAAMSLREKSLGKALPCSRSFFSFSRRSAMIWFSSWGAMGFWVSSVMMRV